MLKLLLNNHWKLLAWIAYLSTENLITSFSVIQEYARANLVVEPWEVFTWEFSSGFTILLLIPAIILFDRAFPLNFQQHVLGIARQIFLHLPATIVFSLLHVGGFVLIRKWIYSIADRVYTFGDWPVELLYEYRKDLVTYFTILAIIYVYRELLSLSKGKARLDNVEPEDDLSLKLIATKGNKKVIIAPDEIDSIEAAGNYVQLNVNEKHYLMRSTMKEVADKLKPFNFARVHRGHIVNEARVIAATARDTGGLTLELKNGSHVECSRRYRQNLQSI